VIEFHSKPFSLAQEGPDRGRGYPAFFRAPGFCLARFSTVRAIVDQLLTKAIAGFLVDLPKGDSVARRRRRVERDWARDE
jgi:hypothetical protein